MSGLQIFLIGALGALAGEFLKLYELRGKLSQAKYRALAVSPLFWAVCTGMVLAAGFVAWAVNIDNNTNVTTWQVLLTALGARGIVRNATEGQIANRGATLGGTRAEAKPSINISDIFA